MSFEWTPHRFSGGALALDIANSVILRFDPDKRTDRFADRAEIDRFVVASNRLCAEHLTIAPIAPGRQAGLLELRERIDACLRAKVLGRSDPLLLANLLESIAATLRAGAADTELQLDVATAQSALRLICDDGRAMMKICGNCEWLFLDRSKNKSRTWCDMAVCGNRVKARLHYQKSKKEVQS